jgi:hypothetical protein
MDTTNITPPIQAPLPKKGGAGKIILWLVIIGVIAGIIFAVLVLTLGPTLPNGRYYPNGEPSGTGANIMGQYYEVRNGAFSREIILYSMQGIPGISYKYKVSGNRLTLTAAGQSMEMTIFCDCRSEFGAGAMVIPEMPNIEVRYINVDAKDCD